MNGMSKIAEYEIFIKIEFSISVKTARKLVIEDISVIVVTKDI